MENIKEDKRTSPEEVKAERASRLAGKIVSLLAKESNKGLRGYGSFDRGSLQILALEKVLSRLIANGVIVSPAFPAALLEHTISTLRRDVEDIVSGF